MIHLDENVLGFKEAARILPRQNGRAVHVSTIFRWWRRGLRGVRLRAGLIGGRRCTSREALQEFFDAVSAESDPEALDSPATSAVDDRADRAAAEELEEAGI